MCTQTDSAVPPAYEDGGPQNATENVERLKRFLVYSLQRDYRAESINTLSYREHSQWHDVGFNPVLSATRDRMKFDKRLDDFIETPCKLLGISSRQVWLYALAQGKNYLLDIKFRTYVREKHQQSPRDWAKKLLADRELVANITDDGNVRQILYQAMDKQIGEWFVELNSEQECQLTCKGEAHWFSRRGWV
jgi:hypothetical protein